MSKKVENSYSKIEKLYIQGEKADVEIYAWAEPNIKVVTELIAKHPNKETATKDLQNLKYESKVISKELYLGSYLLLNKNSEKPVSNLKMHYIVFLPVQIALDINNVFGKVLIKGKFLKLKLKSEFSVIVINDLQGVSTISTKFGEIIGERLEGEIMIDTDHSDLSMKQLSGNCKIRVNYGKIEIQSLRALTKLEINANKAEVQIENTKQFSVEAQNDFGKLTVPPNFTWKTNTGKQKNAFPQLSNKPKIFVKNTFGNTSIEN